MIKKLYTRLFILLIYAASVSSNAQPITLISWNIQHMGQSKDDADITAIARIVKDADIIAIQEVVAKHPGGAKAVARLADQLNRMGSRWDYRISDPTYGDSPYKRERYAFIWRTSRVTNVGRFSLVSELKHICVREPYAGRFRDRRTGEDFYVVNYHSRVHSENPELEVMHFPRLSEWLGSERIIIAGDFNMSEDHSVFDLLYAIGYKPSFRNVKTTLKRKCDQGKYLNHAIDNIYYQSKYFHKVEAYALDFVMSCDRIDISRKLSDHLPVLLKFNWVE